MESAALALALFLCVAAVPGAAAGDRTMSALYNPGNHVDADGVVRDPHGQRIGSIETDPAGGHVLLDRDGHAVGRVEPGFGKDELVIRDGGGRRQGTLERRP